MARIPYKNDRWEGSANGYLNHSTAGHRPPTGGWIDAGFRGTITLEMANVNAHPVKIYEGMSIGQLVFYTTEWEERPYFKKGDAKYLYQRQAKLSRYHANKKIS